MGEMTELTQEIVRELFDYRDGNLYWNEHRSNIKHGDLAGYVNKRGYRYIRIDGKLYLTHRLIFLYHNGYIPKSIDHIDSNPSNNDISNIREATQQENCMNRKKTKSVNGKLTTSKYKGVYWDKKVKKWRSQITINKKHKHLGLFTSEIDASAAYNKAAIKAFGKFAKLSEPKGL